MLSRAYSGVIIFTATKLCYYDFEFSVHKSLKNRHLHLFPVKSPEAVMQGCCTGSAQ